MQTDPIKAKPTAKARSTPATIQAAHRPAHTPVRFSELDDDAFLRQGQIVPDIIPVAASTWLLWVRKGITPKPHKIGTGVTAWRVGDLRAFLAKQQGDNINAKADANEGAAS